MTVAPALRRLEEPTREILLLKLTLFEFDDASGTREITILKRKTLLMGITLVNIFSI